MARTKEKEKAIKLRKKGLSYSQIKAELGISKSTLSGWLRDMPLSKKRLDELQRNEHVIEKIRLAKQRKRNKRLTQVFETVSKDIGTLSEREFFIAGFFLYWAEGTKTQRYAASLSNTDPRMVRAFIKWLALLNVPKDKIKLRLHLYSDMNKNNEQKYWMKETSLPKNQFMKPYIKKSKLSDVTHHTFGHGTCNVIISGRDISEYVLQGLSRISSMY